MPFPKRIRLDALIACQRHCCLCNNRKHTRLTCHHIEQEADGGPNTFANCIPLCPDCHSEVKAFDNRRPFGATSYSHEELVRRRDDWYAVIKRRASDLAVNLHRKQTNYPKSTELTGRVTFDYSNNDGFILLGKGCAEFLTRWTSASNSSIHCYSDRTNLSVALAPTGSNLVEIENAARLDYSSRVRTAQLEQILVFENHESRYCAAQLISVAAVSHGAQHNSVTIRYWILEDGSDDFSNSA